MGCVALADGKSLLVHGGVDGDGVVTNDAYVLDTKAWRWRRVRQEGAPARAGHVLVRVGEREIVGFGGKGGDGALHAETWRVTVG